MNPIVFAMRRPLTVMVAVVLGSGLALSRMPIDIFPNLNLPVVYVCQPYGGMDPARMEGLLTNYYEYHFLYIGGIHPRRIEEHPGHGPDEAMAETIGYVTRSRAFHISNLYRITRQGQRKRVRVLRGETRRRMEPEGEWREKFNECETSLRRLCEQARVEGSSERLSAIGAMTVRIELELLEDLQALRGQKSGRRTPRLLRGVLGFLEAFLRDAGGFFQWAAAGLRVRLGRPIGELMP